MFFHWNITLALVFSVACLAVGVQSTAGRKRTWAVRLKDEDQGWWRSDSSLIKTRRDAEKIAEKLGFRLVQHIEIGDLDGYFLFEEQTHEVIRRNSEGNLETMIVSKRSLDENEAQLIESVEHVDWFEEQVPRKRVKRDLDFNDPQYKNEWFLVCLSVLPWCDLSDRITPYRMKEVIVTTCEFTGLGQVVSTERE